MVLTGNDDVAKARTRDGVRTSFGDWPVRSIRVEICLQNIWTHTVSSSVHEVMCNRTIIQHLCPHDFEFGWMSLCSRMIPILVITNFNMGSCGLYCYSAGWTSISPIVHVNLLQCRQRQWFKFTAVLSRTPQPHQRGMKKFRELKRRGRLIAA